jgi:hypothetical protein
MKSGCKHPLGGIRFDDNLNELRTFIKGITLIKHRIALVEKAIQKGYNLDALNGELKGLTYALKSLGESFESAPNVEKTK